MRRMLAPLLLLSMLSVVPHVGRPARAEDVVLSGQTLGVRLVGRIRAVAGDRKSLELDVVSTTSDSGRQRVQSAPTARPIRLADVTYVFDATDRTVFYGREDLKPGIVATVVGVQTDDGSVIAQEIRLGGSLPTVARTTGNEGGRDITDPLQVKLPSLRAGKAKFEPARGCYLGAFVIQDANVNRRMDLWEETVGKGHASYLTYTGYGRPFPIAWVREVRQVGSVPNIAFEPNEGLRAVRDNAYLRKWARAAAASGGPVFLRFASEMNGAWTAYSGNPSLYRAKFRLVAKVMREEAPNVAMVWTPYCMPKGNIPSYYPGDDAVDWVGVNIYSVHHHNGRLDFPAHREDPLELLRPVYQRYASRKPIQISEYAATSFCMACSQPMPGFAIQKMSRLYRSLPTQFPRVKMIYWFSWDTISGGAAENNYSVTANPEVLATYRHLTQSPYFLSRVPDTLTDRGQTGEEPRLTASR